MLVEDEVLVCRKAWGNQTWCFVQRTWCLLMMVMIKTVWVNCGYHGEMKMLSLRPCTPNLGFPGGSAGKESTCNVRDLGSIPELGRSSGVRKGYPLLYSGLKNFRDYIVDGVAKSDTTEPLSLSLFTPNPNLHWWRIRMPLGCC